MAKLIFETDAGELIEFDVAEDLIINQDIKKAKKRYL